MNSKAAEVKRPLAASDKEGQQPRYALIPARVRYDPNLCMEAKLLYGEMTALCTTPGRCRIESGREARVYKTTKEKIHELIVSLHRSGHIRIVSPHDIKLKVPGNIYEILLAVSAR